jgi:hypothetical protein
MVPPASCPYFVRLVIEFTPLHRYPCELGVPCTVRKESATRRFSLCNLHTASTITTTYPSLDLLIGETRDQVLVFISDMHSNYNSSSSSSRPIPQSAYVQAYESQLVYGQRERAEDLYAKGGRGLMRWQGEDDDDIWADR